jgi:hypothetical protein
MPELHDKRTGEDLYPLSAERWQAAPQCLLLYPVITDMDVAQQISTIIWKVIASI